MKILVAPLHYLLRDSGSEVGWAYDYLVTLGNTDGNQVEALTYEVVDSLPKGKGSSTIKVTALGKSFSPGLLASLQFHFQISKYANQLVKTDKPDVIHHFLPFALERTFSPFFLWGGYSNLPKVIGPIQATQEWKEPQRVVGQLLNALAKIPLQYLSNQTLKRARALIVIDPETEKKLYAVVGDKVRIVRISPGIRLEEYSWQPRVRADKERLRLITVGRLIPRKAVDQIILGMVELQNQGVDFQLDVLGSGPDQETLLALIQANGLEPRVILHGQIARKEVISYYKKAHAYVSMSRSEGLPQVYIEAMACGLPVISASNVGSRAIIAQGKNGYIVEKDNPKQLAEFVHKIYDQPEQLTALSQAARRLIETEYDWEKIVLPRYFKLYADIISAE
jgi:glycosyltransferase involved in cell wall biosynthesis